MKAMANKERRALSCAISFAKVAAKFWRKQPKLHRLEGLHHDGAGGGEASDGLIVQSREQNENKETLLVSEKCIPAAKK